MLRWILLLALLLRLSTAVAVQSYLDNVAQREFLIPGDANGYWELGQKLAHGEAFEIYQPPRRIMRMPGFPLLLAASIKIGGESLFFARCVLAVCGTLACGSVYWLGRVLLNERVGIIAALLAAVSPIFIGFSVEILSETPFAVSLTLSLVLLAKLRGASELFERTAETRVVQQPFVLRRATWAGVLIAVATFMRPTWLLIAPLFGVWHVAVECRQKGCPRRAIIEAALIGIGCAAVLAPWAIRNRQFADGHLIPTTLWVGPSLYDGLHPGATGDSDMQFFEDDRLMASGFSEYEMDREYRRRAWAYAAAHPGRAIELGVVKLTRYWSLTPNASQFRYWFLRLPIGLFGCLTFGFAVRGAWRWRSRGTLLLLTAGPVLYFAAIHCLFVGSVRYRLPAEYPLLVLSAAGIVDWWEQRRVRVVDRTSQAVSEL